MSEVVFSAPFCAAAVKDAPADMAIKPPITNIIIILLFMALGTN
jgi:hypothetical protein